MTQPLADPKDRKQVLTRADNPPDVARVARFLFNDAPYVTSRIIDVDDGCMARL